MQDLQSVQASLTATIEKLTSKSSALDFAVVWDHQMEIKLKAAEEKVKTPGQVLDSTQKVLSKREFSSSTVISSAVANAMALVKNHMPEFDMEILWKGFTVDDTGWEALVDSVYDTAQHFVSLYDFSALAESDDNAISSIL
jgi:predicted nucleotidyltransferase